MPMNLISVPPCSCGGTFTKLDAHEQSSTWQCGTCHMRFLLVLRPTFIVWVRLQRFGSKVRPWSGTRMPDDLMFAQTVVDTIGAGATLSVEMIHQFGIDTDEQYSAMQLAVRHGIEAYELDTVRADGEALTDLVEGIPGQRRLRNGFMPLAGCCDEDSAWAFARPLTNTSLDDLD